MFRVDTIAGDDLAAFVDIVANAYPGVNIASAEEKQRWRETCREHYVACKAFFAGEKQRRVWGESQCQSCMDRCMRDGQWPDEANGHPCPGG